MGSRALGRAQQPRKSILRVCVVANAGVLGQLWAFVKVRKKWWLLPFLIVLLLVGGLLMLAQGSALGPLIYPIF